ncbi:Membrane-associated phospholipid phosphatase [Corynebacterium resistens DSM 45100]|uniref:Membrane-associated phospholipid phosphatase n=1 Tax=Corynebacterium resistens (strain DSM 45100 / JCM 12819 / GTC 2026 / SICGH 158) TaxID=662755 RepID=F8DYP9_CORRG|nr:phosphatase PAP2 family protein [Corynebacterium resistens]AEI08891.1 Membrane-associated phospholipid phosphatase [Corynebacterium resistens DSM 45100]
MNTTQSTESSTITGDPWGESDLLVAIQKNISGQPGVLPTARAMSFFGEHALGWMALAAAGYVLDKPRKKQWLATGVGAFSAHAASVIIKRVIRRPRPHDPRITIGVGTPSKLSFPSSHATSSTAALVGTAQTVASPLPLVGIPAMALSRLVLGVHYPTDVVLGSIIGATTAGITRKVMLG